MIKKKTLETIRKNCLSKRTTNRFYVYAHVKESGEIFYIGKGSGDRAWNINSRLKEWDEVTVVNKWDVVILADMLTEAEAFECEKDILNHFKKFNRLVNCQGNR